MVYQWYPGHMSKAKRQMQEDLKLIDVIIEILDARIPYSSKNPDIDSMANGKAHIILLNKADLADPKKTEEWKKYYEEKGMFVHSINSKTGTGVKDTILIINKACAAKIERDRKKGIIGRPLRAMIAGIPNSGKSTFINSLAGKSCTKTGNKPGVTKGKQWIRLNKSVELLDTPGILWPKFEDQLVGMKIAFIGSINDEILYPEEMVYELIKILKKDYPGVLDKRYMKAAENKSDDAADDKTADAVSEQSLEALEDPNEIMQQIALNRACLKKGGEPDTLKASKLIIDDFRSNKLGRITLE
ncbi:MAG: ribosome biogenesis GTPase YlqF [Lachnospiraceae bacterium]|nr:ribosome biogenesis GTPase YlqF [Lachnospiraceae bacterium]